MLYEINIIVQKRMYMTIHRYEELISPELKWNSISEIPDFPSKDFKSLMEVIQNKSFSLGIDYTMAKIEAPLFYSRNKDKLLSILLFWLSTFLVPVFLIILTLMLNNYWLLVGIILSFSASVLSSPYNQHVDFGALMAGLLCFFCIYTLIQNQDTAFYLSLSFIIPFVSNVFWNRSSWNKLKEVVLSSEKIFIYFYQQDRIFLFDNSNKKFYN